MPGVRALGAFEVDRRARLSSEQEVHQSKAKTIALKALDLLALTLCAIPKAIHWIAQPALENSRAFFYETSDRKKSVCLEATIVVIGVLVVIPLYIVVFFTKKAAEKFDEALDSFTPNQKDSKTSTTTTTTTTTTTPRSSEITFEARDEAPAHVDPMSQYPFTEMEDFYRSYNDQVAQLRRSLGDDFIFKLGISQVPPLIDSLERQLDVCNQWFWDNPGTLIDPDLYFRVAFRAAYVASLLQNYRLILDKMLVVQGGGTHTFDVDLLIRGCEESGNIHFQDGSSRNWKSIDFTNPAHFDPDWSDKFDKAKDSIEAMFRAQVSFHTNISFFEAFCKELTTRKTGTDYFNHHSMDLRWIDIFLGIADRFFGMSDSLSQLN